ncbi:MAG: deoxyribodipyrimidine photo-lyase [bacterium]|nr:deoxyribodipyrimidine photo-lyase [bacterium]
MSPAVILWYRGHDLRVNDNEALSAAAQRGRVLPVYLHAPADEGPWAPGAAARWWLHRSLQALAEQLGAVGLRLILRRAEHAVDGLLTLLEESGATAVYTHRRSEPEAAAVEAAVAQALANKGVGFHLVQAHTLAPLGAMRTLEGNPYRVFTPFYRSLMRRDEPAEPLPVPDVQPMTTWPASDTIEQLGLDPQHEWTSGLAHAWTPGERGALQRLQTFGQYLGDYSQQRDRPDTDGTSCLSPHLRFGELSPRQAWHGARIAAGLQAEPWLRQLAWRDFGHHLLHAYPHTVDRPLREMFAAFPWSQDQRALRIWQKGATGFPFVDAGMRQLWHTGWMHNRVRMIAASFLVKDLMICWQHGARWFWDTLVDADLANNTLGWQWVAGCGADAAPYFRVFNPVTQGEKFDPNADYVRRWVPALRQLTGRDAHRPWRVSLPGRRYPEPMVDHAEARIAALAAYKEIRP